MNVSLFNSLEDVKIPSSAHPNEMNDLDMQTHWNVYENRLDSTTRDAWMQYLEGPWWLTMQPTPQVVILKICPKMLCNI